MNYTLRAVPLLVSFVVAAGCATTAPSEFTASGKRDLSQVMFLRGQFAWWEALPEYQLETVELDLYRAKAELTADGQPYEFKFADMGWSPGTNCGYLIQEEDQTVVAGQKSKANCSSMFENFKFLPQDSGTYHFYFDNRGETPLVFVEPSKP